MNGTSRIKLFFPNVLTGVNLLLGFGAVVLLTSRNQTAYSIPLCTLASWCIIVAAVIDGLDGSVARLTNGATEFGKQFDSFADLIVFGFAPSLLLYICFLSDYSPFCIALPVLFLFAGAFRLARYNCSTISMKKQPFDGLPITSSGGMIAAYSLTVTFLRAKAGIDIVEEAAVLTAAILAFVNSILMLSRITFKTFSRFFFRSFSVPVRITVGGIILVCLVLAAGPTLLALGVIYTLESVARWVWKMLPGHSHAVSDS
jgi:CDP-diacylglycerol--serine O-phosphatidyltransferase